MIMFIVHKTRNTRVSKKVSGQITKNINLTKIFTDGSDIFPVRVETRLKTVLTPSQSSEADSLSAPRRNRSFPFVQKLPSDPFIRLIAVAARGEPRRQLSAPLPGFEKTSTSVLLNMLCRSSPQNYFLPLQSTIKVWNTQDKGETA